MGRYSAFISYSHADSAIASWLHRALEGYRIPKALVGGESAKGPVPRRLKPVFRDRDELPASTDLGAELRAALAAAEHQIVICSERAAQSRWVDEEILRFKQLHGEARTFALIVGGEPYSATRECFPHALRFALGPDGALSDAPAEPIAADMRPGKDGRRLALLKLIAGITGARLDSLVRRDEARRRRRLMAVASGSSGVAIVTAALAIYANSQRIEANRQRLVAEQQRRTAEASLDFLIGTFRIANPATENPRTISAVTLLDRVSGRVKVELKGQPAVSSRLLRATGEIYANLGLPKESERDLKASLALAPARGEARVATLIQLARIAITSGNPAGAGRYIGQAEAAIAPGEASVPQLRARLSEMRGLLAYQEGHYRESAALLGLALRQVEALPGDSELDRARVLLALGPAYLQLKNYSQADSVFARAEQVYLARYGQFHAQTARAFQNRAAALFESGRLDAASERAQRAILVYSRVLDPGNPTIAAAELLRGRILHARGDYAEALRVFASAGALFRAAYGADDYRLGDIAFYRATVLSDAGKPELALSELAEAARVYDKAYGPVDPDQVELRKARARIERVAGRDGESRAACAEAEKVQWKLDAKAPEMSDVRQFCTALASSPPKVPLRFGSEA